MIRKTFFWIHLTAGLLSALPLAAMALTGILLSFEHQIADVATRESRRVPSATGTRLPLDTLVASHDVQWHWVRGHSGDPGNERADALANRGVDTVRGR